jgi:predicted DNA-binding protein (MmcQ/YjbR family)
MDAERARAFLHTLPHVVETVQWGGNLVFWVGNKHLGGKMFAVVDLSSLSKVIAYAAGPEHYAELVEQEGLIPAPYLARIFWIAAETWAVHRDATWEEELLGAHALTYNKLPSRTRAILSLRDSDRKRLIAERKQTLNERQQLPKAATSGRPATSRTQTPPPRSTKAEVATKPGKPSRKSKAASLATVAKAARPKKHRQS